MSILYILSADVQNGMRHTIIRYRYDLAQISSPSEMYASIIMEWPVEICIASYQTKHFVDFVNAFFACGEENRHSTHTGQVLPDANSCC